MIGSQNIVEHKRARPFLWYSKSYYIYIAERSGGVRNLRTVRSHRHRRRFLGTGGFCLGGDQRISVPLNI